MKATYLAIILFFVLTAVGIPISVSMMLGVIIAVVLFGVYPPITLATLFYSSLDSYLLVAIPLFMLAGIVISYGGIARRIFDFSESLLGFLPGSLGSVNVMASMIFGGISGSSVADVAGIGAIGIKEMVSRNYPRPYSAAITVASSTLAVIIPPSILMIIYATIANISVGAALASGLIPGLFITLVLIAVNTVFAIRKKWVPSMGFSMRRTVRTAAVGFPALLAPVVILGGIFMGFFTPTESSAIAFLYCLFIGTFVYRELNAKKLYQVIYEGGRTSGIVAFELASGLLFSNLMTIEGVPALLTNAFVGLHSEPWQVMILINVILLLAGMFLNPGFSIIVLTPLLLPLAKSAGFHPIHFGIIMVTNLAIGLITPPVGGCLYIGSVVSGLPIEKLVRALLPFYVVLLMALVVIVLVPAMSTGFVEWLYRN